MFFYVLENYEDFSDSIFNEKKCLGWSCIDILNNISSINKKIEEILNEIKKTSNSDKINKILYKEKKDLKEINSLTGKEIFLALFIYSVLNRDIDDDDLNKTIARWMERYDNNCSEEEFDKAEEEYYKERKISFINEILKELNEFNDALITKGIVKFKYFNCFNIPKKTVKFYYKKYKITEITSENIKDTSHIIKLEIYEINKTTDLIEVYKSLIAENRLVIRRCNNCHKFFIPNSRIDEKYCDNISPQSARKTCKEYGAKKKYRDNIKNDKIMMEHERTSQYFRMKIRRAKKEKDKKLYEEKFEKYKNNYGKNKIKYDEKKIIEDDFIKWIIEQKNIKKEGEKNEYKRKNKKQKI